MNYALGYAFNLRDLFDNFKYKKLKMSCKDCDELFQNPHRDRVVRKVFKECFKVVLQDIIDNNVTFQLPTSPKKACIHMKRLAGDDFIHARKHGKFKDVDFLASNFSGYQLEFIMEGSKVERTKPIYVDKNLKDKITEKTNQGTQYC